MLFSLAHVTVLTVAFAGATVALSVAVFVPAKSNARVAGATVTVVTSTTSGVFLLTVTSHFASCGFSLTSFTVAVIVALPSFTAFTVTLFPVPVIVADAELLVHVTVGVNPAAFAPPFDASSFDASFFVTSTLTVASKFAFSPSFRLRVELFNLIPFSSAACTNAPFT